MEEVAIELGLDAPGRFGCGEMRSWALWAEEGRQRGKRNRRTDGPRVGQPSSVRAAGV